MKMKKAVLAVAMAAIMAVSLAACGGGSGSSSDDSGSSPANLRFATGGESGTYYAFGGVIAQHATNNAGVNVTVLSSGGSKENVQNIQDGNAEMAFCQTDVMSYAFEGSSLFEESGVIDCFSTMGVLYEEQVQIVTCDPEIKTVADLAGKNVSIGDRGSGVYFNAIDILGAYGLTEDDITPTYQSFGDSADSLKDGKIDAAFIVAGAPTTAITDLSTTKQAYLVGLDDQHVDQLIAQCPYYTKNVIAAGSYKGIDEDVTTVSVGAAIIVSNNVDEDTVYALCKDLYDNAADQVDAHAKYAEVSLEKAASATTVPYHPGAVKYFSEQGITVK